MMRRRSLWISLAVLLLLACSCPVVAQTSPAPQAPAPTVPPLATAAAVSPASTEPPTASPTTTPSPTPSVPQVTPISANVNCRSGDDVSYDAPSVLLMGQVAQIAGRNEDSSWWYIQDPTNPGGHCWVAASVVITSGNLASIPIIAPATAIVTDVTVDASLPSSVFCGGPNPVDFSGTITTSGAAKVKFRWEIRGDKTNTTAAQTLSFSKAGTKDAPSPGAYSVDCGNYSITLHVLSPNDITAMQKFKIKP